MVQLYPANTRRSQPRKKAPGHPLEDPAFFYSTPENESSVELQRHGLTFSMTGFVSCHALELFCPELQRYLNSKNASS